MKLKCLMVEFAADQSGATAIEYGLIAAGIALAIIEIIYALGTNLVAKLQALATALKSADVDTRVPDALQRSSALLRSVGRERNLPAGGAFDRP
ncbi:Flp pilus assembly pilin Flp [Bradyrhizobium sp. LM2.7]